MDLPEILLKQGIQRGSILLSDSFEDIDHAKFFAVMGVYQDDVAGFFFINSRIHPIIMDKPEQLAMQYQMRKHDYDFLRYDSFLSANELQTRPVDILVQSMKEGHTDIVGQLTHKDLNAVLQICRECDLFTAKEKRRFLY